MTKVSTNKMRNILKFSVENSKLTNFLQKIKLKALKTVLLVGNIFKVKSKLLQS